MKSLIKTYLITCIFIFSAVQGMSQNLYSHYIDSTSQWQTYMVASHPSFGACPGPYANTFSYLTYSISGDTIIDGFQYHKLMSYRIDSMFCGDGTFANTNTSSRFYTGIAEDSTKKVYTDDGNRGRKVLWDFGADDSTFCETLSRIDTVWLGTQPRKVYHCDCGSVIRYVIEGVGANTGMDGTTSCAIGHHGGTITICYQQQGHNISLESDTPCRLTAVTNIEEQKKTNPTTLKILPNPNQGTFKVEIHEQKAKAVILDQVGRIVFNSTIKNNELIQLNNIQNGTYLIQISTTAGVRYSRIIVDN